jgi:hypothetical protein
VSASRVATVAGNRAAAQAEAARLVLLAKIPPGAVRLGSPPAALSEPSMGTPAVTSLVDQVVAWRAGLPIAVAGGCPATDQGVTGVTNPGPSLTQRLLPAGQPTAGLRCQYAGGNGHPPWHLVAATRLAGPAARQAAASMARLPLSHADPVVTRCIPPTDGSAEVLALAYPGRPDVDLFTLRGCGGVSNGYISAGSGYY